MAAVLNGCVVNNSAKENGGEFGFNEEHFPLKTNILSMSALYGPGLESEQYFRHEELRDLPAMYMSLPKYQRSSNQQQMSVTGQQAGAYKNLHMSNSANHHQFKSSSLGYGMPVSSTFTSQNITQQKSYPAASLQRSSSSGEAARNYWGRSHPTSSALFRNERHQTKRKSAVELLAESKPFFVKTENIVERTNFVASTLVCSGKRGHNDSSVVLDEGKYNPSYGETIFSAAEAERRYGTNTTHHRSSHFHQQHNQKQSNHSSQQYPSSAMNSSMYHGKFRMSLSSDGSQERDKLARYRKEHYGEPLILNEVSKSTVQSDKNTFMRLCALQTKSVSFEDNVAFRIPPPLYFPQKNYNNMCDSSDEPLVLTENYRPISPPAEYAEDPTESANIARLR